MSKPINSMVIGQAYKGYRVQADAVLDQTNPASGTLYTILDTKKNVLLRSCAVRCTWTVQPSSIDVVLYLDDQTWTFTFANPVSNTVYILSESVATLILNEGSQELATTLSATVTFHRFIESRSVKVDVSVSGGTVQNLYGRCKYSKIP